VIGALARQIVLVALAGVICLATAASASAASTVTVDVFGVEYKGDDGVNNVVVTDEAAPAAFHTRVRIAEAGITAMAGCTQDGVNAAYCDIEDSDRVSMSMLGDNDVATVNGARLSYSMSGGAGDDTLTGADAERGVGFFPVSDFIQGDEGRDMLFGRAGGDDLDSGAGDGDVVEGGEGEDGLSFYDLLGTGVVLRGGPGFDEVFTFFIGPDPVPGVTIDLAAGTAQFPGRPVVQLEGVEDASGDEGPDVLLGDGGVNDLEGEEQADFIDGRGGPDFLDGESGDDRLEGRDGFIDTLDGGPDTDSCDRDQLDLIEACEGGTLVQLPPFGTPVPDRAGPICAAPGLPKQARARRLRRRGLSFSARCDEAGRLAARMVIVLRRVGRRAHLSRVGDVELAARTVTVAAGTPVRMRLRVGRRLRRLLVPRARLRLDLLSTDAAGNDRLATRRVRLR